MTPTREIYWNIGAVWVTYALLAPTLLISGYGFYLRYRLWRLGTREQRLDHTVQRLRQLLIYAFGQGRILNNRMAGLFHALIFFGFVILLIGTLVVMVHEDFGLPIMQGNFYLFFQSLTLDLFGALSILGVCIALYHRYFYRPQRLHNTWQDGVILVSFLAILLTGFIIEGLRIIATRDPWASWSPVGLIVGESLSMLVPTGGLPLVHAFIWWFHLLLVYALIAWLPYSKLLHVLTSPAIIYFRFFEPKGAMLKPINMDITEMLDGGDSAPVNSKEFKSKSSLGGPRGEPWRTRAQERTGCVVARAVG